jgi:hypothetical protein
VRRTGNHPDGACAEFHGIDRDDVAEIIMK